jgi:galactokinase
MSVVERLEACFAELYGAGETRLFFAPGRVNLVGEHTDYNGGYVFPAALPFGTWVMVRPRNDGRFRLASTQFEEKVECGTEGITFRKEDNWANFPKGVIREFQRRGVHLKGADLLFHGNLPLGAGLSSSASIELATATALAALEELGWDRVELVKLSQQAENEFIGVQCGIMDQFASGMGKQDHAILLKCDTLEYRHVPLELGDYRLAIIHSNKSRGLADSKYNERRQECESGFKALQQVLPEIQTLGDVSLSQWEEAQKAVSSAVERKRLRHVITENQRVLDSEQALQEGNLLRFGELMKASHISLRDDYEVTGAELDALFEAACKVEGCIGTRMTGAGFGGCTVNLVHKDALESFKARVKAEYEAKTGLTPLFYPGGIGSGAREVDKTEAAE